MINIVCLKFGIKYSSEYVNRLYRGIVRNTSKRFLFTCYTDMPIGLDPEILPQPLPYYTGDWYSKIGLYKASLHHSNSQIFYFDLDTVITGDLDEILEYRGDFMILRDPYNKSLYGSGLMSWRPEAVDHLWTNYVGQKFSRGDQGWCEIQYPGADIWQEQFPEKIISYKVHIKDRARIGNKNWAPHGGTLDTASIVYFHGKPLPHEVERLEWMQKHWI